MTNPVMSAHIGGARLFPHWSILMRLYPTRGARLFEPAPTWLLSSPAARYEQVFYLAHRGHITWGQFRQLLELA